MVKAMQLHSDPVLWYFADPMCSWCWGFSPVMTKIKAEYDKTLKIALVMGGLRPDQQQPLSEDERAELFHHWHQVAETTAAEFAFDGALPEGFVYNTEPASRAVICAGLLDSSQLFPYFTAVQLAFYLQQQDVRQKAVLQQLAGECGLDEAAFSRLFDDKKQHESTRKSFAFAKKAGVRGFPTLILSQNSQLQVLCRGYADFSTLQQQIDGLLAAESGRY